MFTCAPACPHLYLHSSRHGTLAPVNGRLIDLQELSWACSGADRTLSRQLMLTMKVGALWRWCRVRSGATARCWPRQCAFLRAGWSGTARATLFEQPVAGGGHTSGSSLRSECGQPLVCCRLGLQLAHSAWPHACKRNTVQRVGAACANEKRGAGASPRVLSVAMIVVLAWILEMACGLGALAGRVQHWSLRCHHACFCAWPLACLLSLCS